MGEQRCGEGSNRRNRPWLWPKVAALAALIALAAGCGTSSSGEDGLQSQQAESDETTVGEGDGVDTETSDTTDPTVSTTESKPEEAPTTTLRSVEGFTIVDATGALLEVGDLPPGWENLAPAAEILEADRAKLLLACGEEIELDLGIIELGSIIEHGETATGVYLAHSVRIRDGDETAELLARTDSAAATCDETWTQDLLELGVYELAVTDPPSVQTRGDGTSVYATASQPVDQSGDDFTTTIIQLRCGPVLSRLAVTSWTEPVSDAGLDDLADRAFRKLQNVVQANGGVCQ